MLKSKKGSVLVEAMGATFIVIIMIGLIFTIIVGAVKSNEIRREKRVFNENINIIISEIQYNKNFCELKELFDKKKIFEESFTGDYLSVNGDGIFSALNGREEGERGFYRVSVMDFKESVVTIKLEYGLMEENGEEIFKKYRFIESQERWLYTN